MIVKLLTEHHLEFLRLTGDCRGSSESTLVKMSNGWKFHATAHYYCILKLIFKSLTTCWRSMPTLLCINSEKDPCNDLKIHHLLFVSI